LSSSLLLSEEEEEDGQHVCSRYKLAFVELPLRLPQRTCLLLLLLRFLSSAESHIAISPAYLRRFAQTIIENGFSMHWSAELRLERLFQTELAHQLRKAGCVCISFGYESGSQRVLNLIDKGVKIHDVPGVLKELSHVGIGAQMMGFIGFPTETFEDASTTFEFLHKTNNYWSLSGIGDFVLTSGAIVAKRYHDFGIDKVCAYDGDDIVRDLHWIEEGRMRVQGDMRSPSINKISKSLRKFVDDRPFVGGIDSAHSILYFAKYGPSLVPSYMMDSRPLKSIIEMSYYKTVLVNVDEFPDKADIGEYYEQQRCQGRTPNFDQIRNWLAQVSYEKNITNNNDEIIEIYRNGDYICITQKMLEYQKNDAYRVLKDLLLHGLI
jgi:hypothetical protein